MADTFCGKNCDECTRREQLSCSGCQSGPGRLYGGNCELSKCCRNKGLQACAACGFSESCTILQSRDKQPGYRLKLQEAAQRKKAAFKSRALILGRWLWVLFWVNVAVTIAALMKNNYALNISPHLYLAGQILSVSCLIACGVIVLKLSLADFRYHTAGICYFVVAAARVLEVFSDEVADGQLIWAIIIAIPAAIIGLVGTYNEFHAHSEVLSGVNNTLSEKWLLLWKWYLGCTIAMVGSTILVPFWSTALLLVSSIGVLIIGIIQLVYLYRTANVFRAYSPK